MKTFQVALPEAYALKCARREVHRDADRLGARLPHRMARKSGVDFCVFSLPTERAHGRLYATARRKAIRRLCICRQVGKNRRAIMNEPAPENRAGTGNKISDRFGNEDVCL